VTAPSLPLRGAGSGAGEELGSLDFCIASGIQPAAKLGRGKDSFPTQSEENPMKKMLLAALLSTFAAGALAQEATCKSQASDKNLAGAALKSFMTKCQKDATASCTSQATDKKLSGAAKTSFTKKCVRDAVGT
jgi:hypothetical protein